MVAVFGFGPTELSGPPLEQFVEGVRQAASRALELEEGSGSVYYLQVPKGASTGGSWKVDITFIVYTTTGKPLGLRRALAKALQDFVDEFFESKYLIAVLIEEHTPENGGAGGQLGARLPEVDAAG